MAVIVSVSMSEAQYKFIKESNLSPSKLIQDALTYLDTENVTSMLKHNKEIRAAMQRMINFITEKNLQEEYSNHVLAQK